MENAYLLFGLLSAVLYAIAASSLKAAADRGTRTLQTTLLANVGCAIAFMVFMPWGEGDFFPSAWWPSMIVGALFFGGQWFAVLALAKGHASIATPALGSKVVLVALILAFGFGKELSLNVWVAAFLTSIALGVLAFSPKGVGHGGAIISTIFYSILAAACYALFDVLTQVWSPVYGFGRLMPWAMVFSALLTAPVVLAIDRRVPRLAPSAWRYVLLGVALLVGQSMILIWAIGYYGDAAGINVVYGSRGIWSVLLVWSAGHLFTRQEHFSHRSMIIARLTGAVLIMAAVVLVFWF
jgi:uncharacterized membrane protein